MANKKPKDENRKMDKPLPLWFMILMPFYIVAIFSVLIFLPAGDWRWFEGWAFVISFAVITTISYSIINKENPRVLRNRMKLKKEGLTAATSKSAGSDRFIMPIMSVTFFSAVILPGLAHRFGWPNIPFWIEMAGLAISTVGSIFMNIAILQNAYASKLLDINLDQRLVDTGLYACIRHPLYAGIILMMLGIPIALGFWWAVIPAVISALMMVLRIKFEEEMLLKGMEGYADYQNRVPYKLILGIY